MYSDEIKNEMKHFHARYYPSAFTYLNMRVTWLAIMCNIYSFSYFQATMPSAVILSILQVQCALFLWRILKKHIVKDPWSFLATLYCSFSLCPIYMSTPQIGVEEVLCGVDTGILAIRYPWAKKYGKQNREVDIFSCKFHLHYNI